MTTIEISEGNETDFSLPSFSGSSIELKDISSEIFYIKEQSLQNPERLKQLNDRMDIINSLLLKHRKNSFSEIIELKKEKEKLYLKN